MSKTHPIPAGPSDSATAAMNEIADTFSPGFFDDRMIHDCAAIIDRHFTQRPTASAPKAEGEVVGLPGNVITHRESWRRALEMARDASGPRNEEEDDRGYWEHEIKAFDRTFDRLFALIESDSRFTLARELPAAELGDWVRVPRHYAENIGYAAVMLEASQSVVDRHNAPALRSLLQVMTAPPPASAASTIGGKVGGEIVGQVEGGDARWDGKFMNYVVTDEPLPFKSKVLFAPAQEPRG